ncbi:MAG TPA: YraN family protein [Bryobacteraceae bacterium]|nr:YraN family protein [Bryobacteraceae bacterium]
MLTEWISWALRRWRQCKLHKLPRAQALGPLGEDLAARYLLRAGMRIHERNWRPSTGRGEIDIIASEGSILVFVEVKARTTDEFGAPDRAIGEEKRRHIASAARRFFRSHPEGPRLFRFDTVSIVWPGPLQASESAVVEHVRDAFFLPGVGPTPFAAHIADSLQARVDSEWNA